MFFGVLGASVLGLHAAGGEFVAPLLATQILWINLLTDSAPALALCFEPPPSDVMRHAPRRLTDRVIDRAMQLDVVFIGLVMAAVTLLTIDLYLPAGLIAGSRTLDEARTAGFTVLVFAQLFNAFNARSEHESALRELLTNARLLGAVALSVVLQVLVVYVPFLNSAFGTVPLSGIEWAGCIVIASAILWAEELKKIVAGVRRASRTAVT